VSIIVDKNGKENVLDVKMIGNKIFILKDNARMGDYQYHQYLYATSMIENSFERLLLHIKNQIALHLYYVLKNI